MKTFLKENWFKLVLPISILLGCIILGGFFYASQVNKQRSIEKQQQIELQAKAEAKAKEDQAKAEQDKRDYISKRKEDCLAIYKTESDKYNNVHSWSYIEPSGGILKLGDSCEIIYKDSKTGETFSKYY